MSYDVTFFWLKL